jgi:hypothetical protein
LVRSGETGCGKTHRHEGHGFHGAPGQVSRAVECALGEGSAPEVRFSNDSRLIFFMTTRTSAPLQAAKDGRFLPACPKRRTSEAKALIDEAFYGTAQAVPFVDVAFYGTARAVPFVQ